MFKLSADYLELKNKHESSKGIPKDELKDGIKVEHEHTSNNAIAKQIALDHLHESKKYYTYLEGMEKKFEKKAMDAYIDGFIKAAIQMPDQANSTLSNTNNVTSFKSNAEGSKMSPPPIGNLGEITKNIGKDIGRNTLHEVAPEIKGIMNRPLASTARNVITNAGKSLKPSSLASGGLSAMTGMATDKAMDYVLPEQKNDSYLGQVGNNLRDTYKNIASGTTAGGMVGGEVGAVGGAVEGGLADLAQKGNTAIQDTADIGKNMYQSHQAQSRISDMMAQLVAKRNPQWASRYQNAESIGSTI